MTHRFMPCDHPAPEHLAPGDTGECRECPPARRSNVSGTSTWLVQPVRRVGPGVVTTRPARRLGPGPGPVGDVVALDDVVIGSVFDDGPGWSACTGFASYVIDGATIPHDPWPLYPTRDDAIAALVRWVTR